ncbi:MAG: hypothetical protein AABW48_00080 [Nanoarchaeota archaeon]
MGAFNRESFNEFVLYNNVIGFSEQAIKLKSGRTSHWYADWRKVTRYVFQLEQLTEYIIALTHDLGLQPDCFYGVPEGATKLGMITQYNWAKLSPNYAPYSHILPMRREKPKEDEASKEKYFVGEPRGKTILLEDITATGSSLLATIDSLAEARVPIIAAICLTDRMELRDDGQSVQKAIESKNIPYFALSNALKLLPEAYQRLNPGEQVAKAIEEEFEKYGIEKLKLR